MVSFESFRNNFIVFNDNNEKRLPLCTDDAIIMNVYYTIFILFSFTTHKT